MLTLVNTNPVRARDVVVQTGAFAEHQCVFVEVGGKTAAVDTPHFTVRLAPGAGDTMTVRMKRHVNQPTAALPWDR